MTNRAIEKNSQCQEEAEIKQSISDMENVILKNQYTNRGSGGQQQAIHSKIKFKQVFNTQNSLFKNPVNAKFEKVNTQKPPEEINRQTSALETV